MEALGINTLLMCFGGGVIGASLGGLFSFVMVGFIVLAGCAVILMGGSDFLLFQVGLGPIFGPHVGGFTAGVVAATYASGLRKNHPGGAAKDILSPLMDSSWDVLLVGGLSAVAGHLLLQVLVRIPVINMTDCVASTVVIMALLARLLFQKELPWGNADSIREAGYLGTKEGAISWCPWNMDLGKLIVLGFGVAVFSGAMAMLISKALDPLVAAGTVSASAAFISAIIFVWALAAIALAGMNLGTGSVQKFPVWHAHAILGAIAFMFFHSLVIAGLVGIATSLLQELMARMFWNHGSNHVDPPACAIAVGTLVLNVIHKLV